MRPIPVVTGIDRARFDADILPAGQPVIMKGLVNDWPAVARARQSDAAVRDYLKAFATPGKAVPVSVLPPLFKGRFFYNDEVNGYNFTTDTRPLAALFDWLVENREREDFVTIYAQSVILSEYMPGFEDENRLSLLDTSFGPRMWIGNRVRTQTHFDPSHNIACLVAGRRRFTLFPPDQIDNLYPGPFDFAPGGVPVSMASLEDPDFERFPRLKDALEAGLQGDLEPGDAVFVPYAWWHHVQSREGFNILVNYWWNDAGSDWLSPNTALYAAILTLRDLPPAQKQVWRHILDRYVFDAPDEAVAHLPDSGKHGFGRMTQAVRDKLRALIKGSLRL
ncbi:cupin-like domain-containing protein [Asticcacaulis sp. 201]|uniref:cupin-like domain-containing protein n=1 Tax=Asticcacaulis sp. 201 TaxID=3028787 RepID=UPI002915EAF3|nr:cupin-like domain-containing protein [Asticcacaulis sp. 201]MDV6329827.1 cupin-like domain-containing protein [Asticcacaulis sp. 201]